MEQKGISQPANFSVRGLFKLVRFGNLIMVVLTQYLTAIFLTGEQGQWLSYLSDPRLFLLSVSTVLIAAAGYMINDYYDVKIDYINKPDKVIVGRLLKRRIVMVYHMLANSLALAAGIWLSWKIALVHACCIFLLWLYSNQLKRVALVGNTVIALLTGASVAIVALLYPSNQLLVLIYAIFATFISIIREVIKDMEDMRGDEAYGSRTLPIVIGTRRTKVFLFVLIAGFITALFVLSAPLHNHTLQLYFGLLLLPIVLLLYWLARADTTQEYHRLSTFAKLIMLSGIISMIFF